LNFQSTVDRSQPRKDIDSRKAPRKNVLLTGKIIWGDGAHALDCSILDVSATGARVTLKAHSALPETVFLLDLANRAAHEAVVVSERKHGFGLKFVRTLKLAEVTAPELRFLKRIWIESARWA
jgi:hypothetical protein